MNFIFNLGQRYRARAARVKMKLKFNFSFSREWCGVGGVKDPMVAVITLKLIDIILLKSYLEIRRDQGCVSTSSP